MTIKTKLIAAAALAAFAVPGAALAQEAGTAHPYIGAQVGYHDLGVDSDAVAPLNIDDNALIFGGYAGVDFDVTGNIVVGAEANFNFGNSAIDNEYGAAARIGYRTANGSIVYVRGGYQWVNLDVSNLTGVANPPAGIDDTAGDYLVGVGADIATGSRARIRVGVDTIAFDSVRPTVGVNFAF